jgi:hypothetical protein
MTALGIEVLVLSKTRPEIDTKIPLSVCDWLKAARMSIFLVAKVGVAESKLRRSIPANNPTRKRIRKTEIPSKLSGWLGLLSLSI